MKTSDKPPMRQPSSRLEPPPAIKTQVGGTHYTEMAIQPWEIIERNGMGFFDGNVLKYLLRYRTKNGVEDLKKARHYLDRLIELESAGETPPK